MRTALTILAALALAGCTPKVHIDPTLMAEAASADSVSKAPMIDGLPECEAR